MSPIERRSILSSSRRARIRFSLLALLVFVAAVCALLAWWVQPPRVVAEALFRVSARPPGVFDEQPFDPREYEILRESQTTLLKSDFVLRAALRDPKMAKLSLVKAQSDPVGWLADELEVEFRGNSEILVVQLGGTEAQSQELMQLVDAVARAYQLEVVSKEQLTRNLVRDRSRTALAKFQENLSKQMQALESLSRELEADNSKEMKIEMELKDLQISALKETLVEMTRRLEIENANILAPERVQQIQPAVVRPE